MMVEPARLSPVQNGVQLVTEMVMLGMGGSEYEARVAQLHMIMAEAAFAEIRPEYQAHLREADPDHVLTLEEVTSEANEGTPMAEAYWAATSRFYRRVFQACAAGCN
jgi:hypothetical protein